MTVKTIVLLFIAEFPRNNGSNVLGINEGLQEGK